MNRNWSIYLHIYCKDKTGIYIEREGKYMLNYKPDYTQIDRKEDTHAAHTAHMLGIEAKLLIIMC